MEVPTTITKHSLTDLHEEQLSNGKTNIQNTIELVNIFGGIDKILSDQLTNESLYLDQNQLHQIHQVLTTPAKDQKQNQLRLISTNNDKASHKNRKRSIKNFFLTQKNKFGYSLVKSDNFIRSLFSESNTANVLYILHSKMVKTFAILFASIYLCLIMVGLYSTVFTVFKILCTLILIPYLVFLILSVNKTGFKLVIRSFEFWLKIVYSIIYNVAICIEYYALEREKWEAYNNIPLQIIESILFACVMTLALGCISLFDATKMKPIWKATTCAVVAMVATLWLIGLSLKLYSDANESIINIGFGIGVSISSITISTTRIIFIFAWKQAILIWMHGSTNKCSILFYNPYINWIDDENEENVQYAIGIDRFKSTISIIGVNHDFTPTNNQNEMEIIQTETDYANKTDDEN